MPFCGSSLTLACPDLMLMIQCCRNPLGPRSVVTCGVMGDMGVLLSSVLIVVISGMFLD